MEIKSNTMGKLNKIRNGNVFDSPLIFIRELLQNSQRSKSKRVDFLVLDDMLSCYDNGCGCSDPASVFTLDLSEWESTSEGYGIGFWSCLAIPGISTIKVRSHSWECMLDAEKLFGNSDLSVERKKSEPMSGFYVELKSEWFREHADEIQLYLFDIAKYLPMQVTINEFVVPQYDLFDNYREENFCMQFDNRIFKAKLEICHNYHNVLKLYYEKRLVEESYLLPYVKGVIEIKNGKLTLKEPDRTSYCKDEKADSFIKKLRECVSQLYKSYISENGIDDDFFADGMHYWLELREYERFLRFEEDMVQETPAAQDIPVQAAAVAVSIGSVPLSGDIFERKDICTTQNFGVSKPVQKTVRPVVHVTDGMQNFRDKIKRMRKSVWVNKEECDQYSNWIQVAKYKGLNVIVAKNALYEEALRKYRIVHISELDECFTESYVKQDIRLRNGKEEAFIALLRPICRKYDLPEDTFLLCNISIQSQFVVDGEVVMRKKTCNKKDAIQVYGVTDRKNIFLDRDAMGLWRFSLRKDNNVIGIWEIKALLANVNTIAHELAHFLYDTKDNTPAHYQAEIKIQQEIIKLYL